MKNVRALLMTICLTLCLCGCGSAPKPAAELLMRYADNQPANYPTTRAAEFFAASVEERTGGRVVIQVFPDAELGDEISVFEQMRFGGIDFSRFSSGTMAEFVPETRILQLPYLFRDREHMLRVLDGEIGDWLLEAVRSAGVVGMCWFDAGARNLYTLEPVKGLSDLSGLTIRVQESDFIARMIRLWGAVPLQLPYDQVYSALETERIDGAENNWPSYEATGHYTQAPYYLLDGHMRLPEAVLMSEAALEKLNGLDPTYGELVIDCAREAAEYERTLWQERESESEATVRAGGCVVTALSDAEIREFRDVLQPMYGELSPEEQELLERIQNS